MALVSPKLKDRLKRLRLRLESAIHKLNHRRLARQRKDSDLEVEIVRPRLGWRMSLESTTPITVYTELSNTYISSPRSSPPSFDDLSPGPPGYGTWRPAHSSSAMVHEQFVVPTILVTSAD